MLKHCVLFFKLFMFLSHMFVMDKHLNQELLTEVGKN